MILCIKSHASYIAKIIVGCELPAAAAAEIYLHARSIMSISIMDFFKFQVPFLQSIYGESPKPEGLILIYGAILTLLITLYFTFLNNDDERPVSFCIPLPEQCKPGWKGEVLDDPKIKV